MAVYSIIFSDEEKLEMKRIVLQDLKIGKTNIEIASHIGVSKSTAAKMSRELIEERSNN